MKITLRFKDPDGVGDSLESAARESLHQLSAELSLEEIESLIDKRYSELCDAIEPWVEFGEYVSIEIDTETGTARVLEV